MLTSTPSPNGRATRLMAWLEEFDGPCSEAWGRTLARQLGDALESYMGIDREILTAAFLAEHREG
jgi:hypothetical protein